MANKNTKLSMTLQDLEILLNKQKELVGEHLSEINRQGKFLDSSAGTGVDNATIKNESRKAQFPADVQTLSKYLNHD